MVRLFDTLDDSRTAHYLKPIVLAAILTVLRKSDLLKVKWTDINLEKGFLKYLEQKKRNSRSQQPKTVTQYMSQDLIDLLKKLPILGDYVFCTSTGRRLRNISHAFYTALRRSGISDFHFHDLRHTCASYLLMRGANLAAVQKQLNHANYKTTQRYTHLAEEFQRDQVSKLDGLIAGIQNSSKKLVRSDLVENITA